MAGGIVGGIPLSPPGGAGVSADISVTPLTAPDSTALYNPPASDGSLIADCIIQNYYIKDQHRYLMPVASPSGFKGASASIIQTSAATLLWICDWTATMLGKQPPIPNPTSTDPNWVLLDDWWQPEPLILGGPDGGTLLYTIHGTYYYAHTNPANLTNENIVFPLAPWIDGTSLPQGTRVLPSIYLTKGLSDLLNPQFVTVQGTGGTGSTAKGLTS